MTHFLPQINFENNFLLATKGDLRDTKERINKLLIGLICLKYFAWKYYPARKTKYIYEKSLRSLEYSRRLTKAVLCLWAEIGNPYRTKNPSDCRIRYRALREKIQGFTTRGVIFLPKGRRPPPPLPPTIQIPNFTFYFHIVRAWKVYRKYKLSKLHCNSLPNKNCTL